MRPHRSRWPALLALSVAAIGGGYSVLGLVMIGSLYGPTPTGSHRFAVNVYLAALAVATFVAVAAVVVLVRAYRSGNTARGDAVE